MQNFYPERQLPGQAINDIKVQYEGVKASHEADLSTVENCLGKCSVSLKYQGPLNEREGVCLRKCFVKYLDSALLVNKEMSHYVHGQSIWAEIRQISNTLSQRLEQIYIVFVLYVVECLFKFTNIFNLYKTS